MTQAPDSQKKTAPHKKSALGWLFSVRTDGLISPLARSTQVFLQVLATTFAVYKLLPKDYPGLRDLSVPLSFKRIMADAWGNVEFTKPKLLQTIIFFAVVGVMFFGALFVFLGIASVFVGTAHAQTGMFDPAGEDVAYAWLNYIFLGGTLPTYDGSGISSTEWGTREGLKVALGFYSGAILVIAALLLFYYLVVMVIDTAHKGVPMGNAARQVWAPIRLVVAIGLLVPISGGLSSGQFIAVKTAQLGSNLASQGWAKFVEKALGTSDLPQMYVPNTYENSKKMFLNFACKADLNTRLDKMEIDFKKALFSAAKTSSYTIVFGPLAWASSLAYNLALAYSNQTLQDLPGTGVAVTIDGVKGKKYAFEGKPFGGKKYPCGWYFIPDANLTAANAAAIFDAHEKAFDKVFVDPPNQTAWSELARNSILSGVRESSGGFSAGAGMEISDSAQYEQLMILYQNTLLDELEPVTPKTLDTAAIAQINAKKTQLSAYGWAFAGAFVATIQRIQAQLMNSLNEGLPIVGDPELLDEAGDDPNPADPDTKANISLRIGADLLTLKNVMSQVGVSGGDTDTHIDMTAVSCAASLGASKPVTASAAIAGETTLINKILKGVGSIANKGADWALNTVFSMIDYVASFSGVWQEGLGDPCAGTSERVFKLGVNFQTGGGSPFLELIAFGHKNVTAGLRLTVQAIALYAGGGVVGAVGVGVLGGAAGLFTSGVGVVPGALGGAALGAAAGSALGKILAMILITVALAFLLVGFSFAYIMPMVPFVRFFFAVIVWLGEVLESIIAVPLIALAQLNPEGEGLPGQARQAYHFLFSIFLRPILTVFGLICGILLFVVASNFLTAGYGIAVAAYGGTAYEYQVLTKIVYTLLYTFMMLLCANKCFEMITHIPNGAMEWMASRSSPTPHLGDIQEMQRYEQIIGGLATTKLVGGIKSVGFAVGDKVNAAVKGAADSGASKTSGGGGGSSTPS